MQTVFSLIDKREDINEYSYNILLADKTHPLFVAHFEVLAGFLQIEIVTHLLKHDIKKIIKAKFLSLIKPEDRVSIQVSSKDGIRYKAIIKDFEEQKVSELIYEI
ncbi:MAG: 3-hydroxyacyl-ACP dehydratase [Sulfuricurvum sp.]|jgi:hypothetical protein